ncbi:MAG: ABC transporter ATP-binding protein [Crocosphaera sp.]|nr:ABC transporter ATP-binding protein [Crocosphaera sp.]
MSLHNFSGKTLIRLENVSLVYNNNRNSFEALYQINLEILTGEFICVIGPSGCGKTSLLQVIAGYQNPTQGSILVGERPHNKPNAEVGVVFQTPNLFPWLKIEQNIEFGPKMKGIPKPERQKTVQTYLNLVGLVDAGQKFPYQLSGGMKQRAAIARVLAADPKIILMDEPFSALDALTRESMVLNLYQIWQTTQKSIFFITHNVEEALLLSTRVLVMHSNPGRIVQDISNPFAYQLGTKHPSAIRADPQFVQMREHLISSIRSDS